MQTIHARLVNTEHATTSLTGSCTQPATNKEATAPETTNAPPSTGQNHSFGDAETRPPKILRRSGFSYPRIPSASGFSLSGCFWCLWECLAGFGCYLVGLGAVLGLVACVLVLACFTGCCARRPCNRLEGVRVRAPVVQRLRMRLRTGVLCRSTSVSPARPREISTSKHFLLASVSKPYMLTEDIPGSGNLPGHYRPRTLSSIFRKSHLLRTL